MAAGDARAALRVYFRAIRAVPWCKVTIYSKNKTVFHFHIYNSCYLFQRLWCDSLQHDILQHMTADELAEIAKLMMEKEIRLRVAPLFLLGDDDDDNVNDDNEIKSESISN